MRCKLLPLLFLSVACTRPAAGPTPLPDGVRLEDEETAVVIGEDGRMLSLRNRQTGTDYAGGQGLWRLYYNTLERKEIEVKAAAQKPTVTAEAGVIRIAYDRLVCEGDTLEMGLELTMTLEEGRLRFAARVENREPHTIVRELQYPLVGDLALPEGFRLLTTHTGGQLFDNPQKAIADIPTRALYMTPAQKFRQFDLQYPRNAAADCFAFVGDGEGLYFGSHDASLQQTWHGLRAYPSEGEQCGSGRWQDFGRLEAGFYRYPNACCGDVWTNDCSVLVPYCGSWTETARLYRAWADSWWEKQAPASWVPEMNGWQRIIFKHQYGEYLRHYPDLPGRIFEAGRDAGCNTVLAFGWWDEGMDNGYPNYSPDASQGGDAGWAEAVAAFRAKGGRLIQYFNGRLIDVESDFYRSGEASKVSNHDNTGREFTEHYKFTGEGTTLGYYDSRTFVIADMSQRAWRDRLLRMADRAMAAGADAVFYDQLGVAEEFPDWDLSGEFPIQDLYTGRYKAESLKEIRDYVKARNPEFGLGTEWLSDCTSQYCDFVHIVEFTALPESFPEWFRYAFPEVIWSDRCVRDEADMVRRVGNTLLKGLRNDIEVFRCRGLIDETPAYQKYLRKVNDIRRDFPELLSGRFIAADGIRCSDPEVTVRGYAAWPEGFTPAGIGLPESDQPARICVVATTREDGRHGARISISGYHLTETRTLGSTTAFTSGQVSLQKDSFAILRFEKD